MPLSWAAARVGVALVVVISSCVAVPVALAAQDPANNPEELNRKYQDALAQLKAAQDRKNELATENEKLNARVADMEKQLDEMKRQVAAVSEQTWHLRMHYAAWEAFLKRHPQWLEKWRVFLERDPLSAPADMPEIPSTQGADGE